MSSSLSPFNLSPLTPKPNLRSLKPPPHFPTYLTKASSSPPPNLSTDPPPKKSFAEATGDFFLGFASRIIKNRIEGKGNYGSDDVKIFGYDDDVERENVFWGVRKKDVEAERNRKTVSSPGFSFSAAGFLFPYYLGVGKLLIEKGYIKQKKLNNLAFPWFIRQS